ncbi:hypothetical protein GETHLI_05060 [Geothrix limicola]|uniref:DUF1175 family protein n=1 Tax=Geothrix limicola TaxID=2927978 RepID=A0ABQ5QBS5_9BACT|nr:DUF1175 family protein [Geothrix limicola]GLH72004.1 hypothetical protein GETHLI_05060 [Geothrix limicola]
MTPTRLLGAASAALALGACAALVPVRHRAVVEFDPANPIRHVRVESRSLLGLRRTGWGVSLSGGPAWGDARTGFFLGAEGPATLMVRAWPGFRQSLSVPASGSSPRWALSEEGDREAFRTWFVALLEQQLEAPSPAWEGAQRDCAGLLRFAFREALAPHTEAWRERVAFTTGAPGQDPSPSFARDWRKGFPTPEGLQPFAKGAYLRRLACVSLGRDLEQARPGDLIFFGRGGARNQPDHVMAFVRSDVDGAPVLLYHTGPEGSGMTRQPGEIRRVRLDDLLHHPDPDFRPLPENPAFLGLYRWRLLAAETSESASLSRS